MRGLKPWCPLSSPSCLCRIFYRCVDWNDKLTELSWEWKSHLLQMRGLKQRYRNIAKHLQCRIFYRCVDWNWTPSSDITTRFSRIFYRCVDWNLFLSNQSIWNNRRIFYRCVDWNCQRYRRWKEGKVASFTDAWIETLSLILKWMMLCRRIFYRCVDWNKSSLF